MRGKVKHTRKTADYLGVRIYVKDARTERATVVKNAINHTEGIDLGVRDVNDRIYLKGLEAFEKEYGITEKV